MAEESRIQKLSTTTENVQNQVDFFVKTEKIVLPAKYSAGNALRQFQLMVQDNEKLMECTMKSLAKCMLDMCILGLNPSKSQCYAVPFGGKATLMPSYLGNIAIAKRIDPTIQKITARAIHKGEEFEFEDTLDGYSKVIKHKRTLSTMEIKNPLEDVVGAYATIIRIDGRQESLIMPMSEIVKRWKKSKAKPFDKDGNLNEDSVHYQFPDRMACRTVINAICKPIISTSDDTDLFGETTQSVFVQAEAAEANAEAEENMCEGEMVDVDVEFEEMESENSEE